MNVRGAVGALWSWRTAGCAAARVAVLSVACALAGGCSSGTPEAVRSAEDAGGSAAAGATRELGIAGRGGAGLGGGGAGGVEVGTLGAPAELGSGVVNARDVGGLPTSSGLRVRRGVLFRSGELSQVDCQRWAALGIATVIDLRDASDAASTPDAACVTEGARYVLGDFPKLLPPSAESYSKTLDAMEPGLAALFGELGRGGALPAILHCVIGRDRASLTMALVLLALEVPVDLVVRDFVENQETPGSTSADWLSGVLERISSAGGIEEYLGGWGVAAADIARLREEALE